MSRIPLLLLLLLVLAGCPTPGRDDDAGDDDDTTTGDDDDTTTADDDDTTADDDDTTGDDDDTTGDDDDDDDDDTTPPVDPCPAPISLCAGDCLFNVSVDPVRLTGLLSWDGAPIPSGAANAWDIVFVDPTSGEELSVPRTASSGAVSTYDIPALPGTWDVFFEWTSAASPGSTGDPDPVWGRWLVASSFNVPTTGGTLNIQPDPVRMTGLLQWDGAAIPASGSNDWSFVFVSVASGREYLVHRDASQGATSTFDIPMFSGTYDVYFAWRTAATQGSAGWPDPIWGRTPIQTGFTVPTTGGTLSVQPDPVRVTGLLQWDGASIPQSASNTWQLVFSDTSSDAEYIVPRNASSGSVNTMDIPMYPGTYAVSFEWLTTPGQTNGAYPDPVFGRRLIQPAFNVPAGGGTLSVQPDPERVTGLISWDGAAIPSSSSNKVQLIFADVASDAEYVVRRDASGISTYDVPMFTGTYDVYFDWYQTASAGSGGWPDPVYGRWLVQGGFTVGVGGSALNVQPDPVRLTGLITWDGAAIFSGDANVVALTFDPVGSDTTYSVLRMGAMNTYDVPMYPGTYDVSFDWYGTPAATSGSWPDPILGATPVATALTIPAGGGTANIQPDPRRLTGLLEWDGGPMLSSGSAGWQLLLVDPYTAASWAAPRETANFPVNTYDMPVYDGVVHVYFQWTGNPGSGTSAWMDPIYGAILLQSCALIQ